MVGSMPSLVRIEKNKREDTGSIFYFVVSFVFVCSASFLEWNFNSKAFGIFTYFGGAVLLFGALLWWYAKFSLRSRLHRKKIFERRQMVMDGPFKVIKHPCYLGTMLMQIGIFIFFESVWGLAAFLLFALPFGIYRMNITESELEKHYGKAYKDYAGRKKRLIPGIY